MSENMVKNQILYYFHFLWPPIGPPWCHESWQSVGGRDCSLIHQLKLEIALLKTRNMFQSQKR